MKKWSLFLGVYLCLCLLAACGMTTAPTEQPPVEEPAEDAPVAVDIFRVVGDENGFLLAEQDGGTGDVFFLPEEWTGLFRGGELVEVSWSGNVQETYPAQLAGVTDIREL